MALQRLKDALKSEKDLSGVTQTQISLPFISAGVVTLRINVNKSEIRRAFSRSC